MSYGSFVERNKRWLLPTLAAALAGVVWLNLPGATPEGRDREPAADPAAAAAPQPAPGDPGPPQDAASGEGPSLRDNDALPLLLAGRQALTPGLRAAPQPPLLHPDRWRTLYQPAPPDPGGPAGPAAAPPGPLGFLLASTSRREAWVDGRAYRPGDTLPGGYVLKRITPAGVVVAGPGGERVLPLQSAPTPPTPRPEARP